MNEADPAVTEEGDTESQSGTPQESDSEQKKPRIASAGDRSGGVRSENLDLDEDVEVIHAVLRGERHRFAEIVERHRRRAYSIAYSFVQNSDDAMDMTQESFLKCLRAIKTFDTEQRFFPWFYKIIRNNCLSFLKRKKLRRKFSLSARREDGESDIEIPDETFSPTDSIQRDETRMKFWVAFQRLKDSDRQIITLRHFEELSYEEIAEALEIPIGTVMSRLFHARRKIKERMEPHL